MSASGGTGLHGVLQEATGCAMDTEREWVAQLSCKNNRIMKMKVMKTINV